MLLVPAMPSHVLVHGRRSMEPARKPYTGGLLGVAARSRVDSGGQRIRNIPSPYVLRLPQLENGGSALSWQNRRESGGSGLGAGETFPRNVTKLTQCEVAERLSQRSSRGNFLLLLCVKYRCVSV
jgi:hypothetical protein